MHVMSTPPPAPPTQLSNRDNDFATCYYYYSSAVRHEKYVGIRSIKKVAECRPTWEQETRINMRGKVDRGRTGKSHNFGRVD